MSTAAHILRTEVGSMAPAFLAVLAIHVLAGLTSVIAGAAAALARKGSSRHRRAGRLFYRAISLLFATATILAAAGERWRDIGRDNALAADGILVLRYGWADVSNRPCDVASQIGDAAGKRGWPGVLRRCGPDCCVARP